MELLDSKTVKGRISFILWGTSYTYELILRIGAFCIICVAPLVVRY